MLREARCRKRHPCGSCDSCRPPPTTVGPLWCAATRTPYAGLLRLGCLLVGQRQTSEDLVHEAFTKLYADSERLSDPTKALAYLRTSVVNLARGRHRRFLVALKHEPAAPVPTASAEETALSGVNKGAVVAALHQLPDRQRECLVLRHYLGMTEGEIANAARGVRRVGAHAHQAGHGHARAPTGRTAMKTAPRIEEELSEALHAYADRIPAVPDTARPVRSPRCCSPRLGGILGPRVSPQDGGNRRRHRAAAGCRRPRLGHGRSRRRRGPCREGHGRGTPVTVAPSTAPRTRFAATTLPPTTLAPHCPPPRRRPPPSPPAPVQAAPPVVAPPRPPSSQQPPRRRSGSNRRNRCPRPPPRPTSIRRPLRRHRRPTPSGSAPAPPSAAAAKIPPTTSTRARPAPGPRSRSRPPSAAGPPRPTSTATGRRRSCSAVPPSTRRSR